MNVPISVGRTSLFQILGVLGGIFPFYSNSNRTFCEQTEETLIRRRVLIWVCAVCLYPTKRTIGLWKRTIGLWKQTLHSRHMTSKTTALNRRRCDVMTLIQRFKVVCLLGNHNIHYSNIGSLKTKWHKVADFCRKQLVSADQLKILISKIGH